MEVLVILRWGFSMLLNTSLLTVSHSFSILAPVASILKQKMCIGTFYGDDNENFRKSSNLISLGMDDWEGVTFELVITVCFNSFLFSILSSYTHQTLVSKDKTNPFAMH